MYKLFLFLHLITAIFAIGPLVHAATTAVRGLRSNDAAATASAARTAKVYSYASVAVVVFGFGLMSMDSPFREGEKVAEFSETWICLSVLLWVVGVALVLAVLVPSLEKATTAIGGGTSAESAAGKVAASGGVIALIFLVIVVLMVWQPGG